jgi:arylsulfatase A-like enzyme
VTLPFPRLSPFVAAVIAASTIVPGAYGCRAPAASPRPNIVLITIDTLRADHTSAYGYFIDTTPTLRRLAAHGILFRRAYSPSATTGPSHAALFSGRPARAVGVLENGHRLDERFTTLAEVVAAAGYQTAAFVSSQVLHPSLGYDRGFEIYDNLRGDGRYLKRDETVPTSRRADETVDALLGWLGHRPDPRPLFVWMHLFDPHKPYHPPMPFDGRWPPETQQKIQRYDSEIRYADSHISRVIDRFDEMAGRDGTVYVVTADHGEAFGEHGWHGHGAHLHEEAVRVPLVLTWRGHVPAREVTEPAVSVVDIAPTLLHLLRLPIPAEFGGRVLTGKLDPDRPVFVQRREYRNRRRQGAQRRSDMVAIIHKRWKYLRAADAQRSELYYLARDPAERFNLLDRAPTKRAELEALVQAWLDEHPRPDFEQPEPNAEVREALRALGYTN